MDGNEFHLEAGLACLLVGHERGLIRIDIL